MFKTLQVTNFRKLRDSTFDFNSGLNAIRGLNEQGKSTLFEALAYAMFGVDALREPLADVVTWGEKETSLKVVLDWTVNTSSIQIRRSKSGAEISVDGKLVATGQKEVTRFVEGLLGAPPKVASKLMLANQASLRGALSDGPTATAQLIEQLSNFALIDEVIQLVIDNLPTGVTTAVEQQIKTLGEQMAAEAPGELDMRDLEAAVLNVEDGRAKDEAQIAEVTKELPAAKAAADAARALSTKLVGHQRDAQQARDLAMSLVTQINKLQPQSSVTPEQVAALREQVREANSFEDAKVAWVALHRLQTPDSVWEGDRAGFDAAVAENKAGLTRLALELSKLQVAAATVGGKIIKETSCAFCGKDLKDVPEVLEFNGPLKQELLGIRQDQARGEKVLEGFQADEVELLAIAKADRLVRDVYAKHHAYFDMVETTVPPTWAWKGPDMSGPAPGSPLQALRAAEAEITRAAQDQGRRTTLDAQLVQANAKLLASQLAASEAELALKGDRSIGFETDMLAKLKYHQDRVAEFKRESQRLGQAIQTAKDMHAMRVATQARLQAAHAAALVALEQQQLNNVLLRKLRGARPKVADKLWAAVLSTVSYYFSAIRGTQSVVTRDDAGFKVDGKPVPGLSGSTLDALGLAIRIALTKTFLPNNDFLILDEPAAACDDGREANMLAVITTAGFDQVLLVTHSNLADAYADRMIYL